MPPVLLPRSRRNGPLRILYLGRVVNPQKRVRLFPHILTALQAAGVPFRWTIAGEGEERPHLERAMTSRSATQQVHFIGRILNRDVPALLEQQDVLLLASDAEGLPLSLLEAMGYGLVPVISDLESGVRDVVNPTNGMLIPINDSDGYAEAICHLHKHRDELASKSAAAQQRVRTEFSTEAMTGRWLEMLRVAARPAEPWPKNQDIQPLFDDRYPFKYWTPFRTARRWVRHMGLRAS